MAPDQVLAAQMWNWPDAAIKRDANGAVVFVNAAFLSLYGGEVANWQGMAVTGWNAPPPAGHSVRFETRIPTAEGEQVFDWIEACLPDGTALAIARDVTAIVPAPGGEPAHIPAQTPAATAQAEATAPELPSAFETVMASAAPQTASAAAPSAQPAAPAAESFHNPAAEAMAQAEAPAAPTAPVQERRSEVGFEKFETPTFPHEDATEPAAQTPSAQAPAPAQAEPVAPSAEPVQAAPAEAPASEAPQSPASNDEREFERRALPVEDTNAVLGNNWRDAVIAKAVGATGAQAPDEPAAEAPAAAPASPSPRAAGDPIRILLAEDNAINALLTRTLLEAEGCTVDTVEDGALAVEAVKANVYDLIFMDMRMPNMDGLDATRKIRSMDHRSKGLPIVALTANAFDDDRNACFDSGMNDFMTKPVSAEELSEMVARWTSETALQQAAAV